MYEGASDRANSIHGFAAKFQPITEQEKRERNLNETGFIVTSIPEDSSLIKAGLREDDIVLLINNRKFLNQENFNNYIANIRNNTPISVLIKTKDNKIELKDFIFKTSTFRMAADYYYIKSAAALEKRKLITALKNAKKCCFNKSGK